jgi:NAD(P)H-dependent flavin oxidoreductase YrpB (nitropropane dioxygenase family)
MLRNDVVREWEESGKSREDETIGVLDSIRGGQVSIERYSCFMTTPGFHGDIEEAPLWAGESVALVRDIRGAGDIVRSLVEDAETALYSTTTYSNAAQQSTPNRAS